MLYKSKQDIGARGVLYGGAQDAKCAAFCSAKSTLGQTGLLPLSLPSPNGKPKLFI